MTEVAVADADTRKRASPGELGISKIIEGTRVEHRLAGRSAGAPIFGDLAAGYDAKIVKKRRVIEAAQRILVEDGNLLPLARIVELVGIDGVELAFIPGRFLGQRERISLALALDALDL